MGKEINYDLAWPDRVHPIYSAEDHDTSYGALIADPLSRPMVRGLTAERVIRPTKKH